MRPGSDGSPCVLVVEDEPDIAATLEAYLRRDGFRTERAGDGATALRLVREARPDLVLLDVMLPGLDGLEVLRRLRADEAGPPVILATARSEELDRVLGLELGADDYVVKPFSVREVVARVKAVLRRGREGRARVGAVSRVGALEVDEGRVRAALGGVALPLTLTEFRLLAALAAAPGRVFTRGELLERAMPESDALERTVDSHLRNLRRKLAQAGEGVGLETVRGLGYRLVDGS